MVGEPELVLVGLAAPEAGGGVLVEHRLGQPQQPRGRPHLGLVEVGDGLDVRRGVAEAGEVAEQVLGAVLGADHERVQLLGEVVDHDHPRPGAGIALPDRRLRQRRAHRLERLEDRVDADGQQVGLGQARRRGERRVVDVHLLGVA